MHRFLPALPRLLLVLSAFVGAVVAQCPLQWQPGDPIPYVNGDTRATVLWDADGAGPTAPVLVVGGQFRVGNMAATPLAAFDGASWSALGTPPRAATCSRAPWRPGTAPPGP